MSAVVEATRANETVATAHEAALLALRKDKEHTISTFTEQLRQLQQQQLADNTAKEIARQKLEVELAEAKAALEELRHDSSERVTQNSEELRSVQKAHDALVYKLVKDGGQVLDCLQRRERDVVTLEETLLRSRLCWSETGARSQLALIASRERNEHTIRKLKSDLRDKEALINRVQSEKLALEHDTRSAKSALETERGVLSNRVNVLERAQEEEKDRIEKLASELMAARDQAKIATAAVAESGNSHAEEMQRLQSHLKVAREEIINLKTNIETSGKTQAALQVQVSTLTEEKTQLQATLTSTTSELNEKKSISENAQSSFESKLVAEKGKLQEEITAVRRQCEQKIAAAEGSTSETQKLTDAVIAEKDVSIESLKEQVRHLEGTVQSLTEANAGLAKRISSVRDTHNKSTEQLVSMKEEMTLMEVQRNAAVNESTAAVAKVEGLVEQLTEAKNKINALSSSITQLQKPGGVEADRRAQNELASVKAQLQAMTAERNSFAAKVTSATAQEEAAKKLLSEVGTSRGLAQKLSLRTQEIEELKEENKQLTERLLIIDCKYATSETRLNHSLQDGAQASVLLEKGLRRVNESAHAAAEVAETKAVLLRSARTIRQALEDEGYTMTSLPLAPTESLDIPYLQEVLLDHANMAATHLKKSTTIAAGSPSMIRHNNTSVMNSTLGGAMSAAAVPSALRTPLVYRK